MLREQIHYDVLIVGAGPAGLAAAIYLKKLSIQDNQNISICVLEKASAVGAHSLSGALLDVTCLSKLLDHWENAPLQTPVKESHFLYLTSRHAVALPAPHLHQKKDYVVSLGELCHFLAQEAQVLGIDIYPNFAASEVLYDEKGAVQGVLTGVAGLHQDATSSNLYEPGVEMLATYTVFAEGCRGSLSQQIIKRFELDANCDPQHYGLGIKELWEIEPQKAILGKVIHTIGWPLSHKTYGGGFLYHCQDNRVAIGFIVGLDYSNPYLSPFEEFQRFKRHPVIQQTLAGGRRVGYGARSITEGGIQSLPALTFPGGMLVGDAAGFLNVQKIKGIHTAIESGILVAQALRQVILNPSKEGIYEALFKGSALYQELWKARNIRPAFQWSLYPGLIYSALDTYLFKGRTPWTLHYRKADHLHLSLAQKKSFIPYSAANNISTFDKTSSVFLSNTHYRENQPIHLVLKDNQIPITLNLALYDAPETRYCPAKVYEILSRDEKNYLQINAQNCIHCKACDIKDPTQNIVWTTPEGGDGPNYVGM